jgi:hypothetical protein
VLRNPASDPAAWPDARRGEVNEVGPAYRCVLAMAGAVGVELLDGEVEFWTEWPYQYLIRGPPSIS